MSTMPVSQSYKTASSSCPTHPHPSVPLQPRAQDLMGPLPPSADGFINIFTIIDRTTRWLEAIPLKEMTASTCSAVFLSSWVARFGVQATLTSDRGTQFSSATWQQLCSRLGMKHIITTSYHPQANGRVKRPHRQLKDPIRAREAGADWPDHLPWVLLALGLSAAPKESTGYSSARVGHPFFSKETQHSCILSRSL